MTKEPDTKVTPKAQTDDEDSFFGLCLGVVGLIVIVFLFVPWWIMGAAGLALSAGIRCFDRWTRE